MVAQRAARRVRRARRGRFVTVNVGRPLRGRLRERAVRPREGRLHRRARPTAPAASSWPTAARSSSTRSRNIPLGQQAQAPARARDRRVRARRLVAHAARRTCASSPRRTPTCRAEVAAGTLPPGPALPPQHGRDPRCRRCASGARTSAARAPLPEAARRGATARRSPASTRRRSRRCSRHAWPGNVRELDHAVERAVLHGARRRACAAADLGAAPLGRRRRAGSRR